MEQKIIQVITEQMRQIEGVNVNVINQNTPRVGHFIMIEFQHTDTELVCRWYKKRSYFDCWYRRKKGGNYRTRPYNSDVLYRVQDLRSAKRLCQLISLGQELSINGYLKTDQ